MLTSNPAKSMQFEARLSSLFEKFTSPRGSCHEFSFKVLPCKWRDKFYAHQTSFLRTDHPSHGRNSDPKPVPEPTELFSINFSGFWRSPYIGCFSNSWWSASPRYPITSFPPMTSFPITQHYTCHTEERHRTNTEHWLLGSYTTLSV